MPEPLLILSAIQFEVKPVLDFLELEKITYAFAEFGIGPINAAKSAHKLLKIAKGKRVFLLGSAGTFGDFENPYLVTAHKTLWMPTAERMGLAKSFQHIDGGIDIPVAKGLDLPRRTVLTSSGVSLNDTIKLPGLGLPSELIENMELYPIISELLEAASSLEIIYGITNKVGSNGSIDWQKNHQTVASMTAEFLKIYLK